ncbi:Ig-like domain-containing protein [Natronomonas sp.]|uniref:Ig-like domain-containing protein n=1 Tax=Natronomonas sp. TaxID=2184060 RepID=UPI002FC2A45E
MTRPEYVPDDAVDITDYGAVSNPDDPADGSYSTNRQAIIDAGNAAGRSGNIYVPEGTYFFGEDDSNSWIVMGAHTAAGLSFYGDGPGKSVLGMTEHCPESAIGTMFRYNPDEYDTETHTATWKGLKLEGNAQNLGNKIQHGVGSLAIISQSGNSELTLQLDTVYIHDTYSAAVKHREGDLRADYCTFERVGIEITNDTYESSDRSESVDHCLIPQPDSDKSCIVDHCEFVNASGNAIDAGGDGTIETYSCWGSGLGVGWYKVQDCKKYVIENTYMEPNTQALEDLLVNDWFIGHRGPFYSVQGDTDVVPIVETNHVKCVSTTLQSVLLYNQSNAESNDAEWRGDMIAFHDSANGNRDAAIRTKGNDLRNTDINRISVHDSDVSQIFDVTGDGAIESLTHENSGTIGSTEDVTIQNSEQGGDPLQPDVPSRDEVGVDAVSDAEETDEDTEEDTTDSPLFDDWTPQWASDSDDWSVVSGDQFAGGNALAFEHDGETRTRYAFSCDNVGAPADVEVLDKFRVPAFTADESLGFHARVNLRSSSSSAGENGYWIEVESPENSFRLAKYTDGSLTTLGRFGTPEEDTFYYRRFRAEGNELKAKVWKASENEPSEWDIVTTDSDHADGWVGLGSFDTGLVETDVFSVATDGGTASHLNSDTAPKVAWQSPNNGETVSGTISLEIDAEGQEDDDSPTVEYRIDDGTWQTASYNTDTGYYEDTWDTTGTADGDRTLEAKATDSAGNSTNTSITVTVDNSLSVETIGVENVTDASTTLVGDVTGFGGADGATCYFEWREQGTETWNTVGEQTRSSLGEFSADLTGLEAGTSYEFQAVVETADRATGSIRSFDTGTDGTSLSIDRFALTDKSNPSWSWYEVDWAASDVDGELDTVVSELRYNGNTVTAESTNVSGETASFTHEVRVQGDVDEIRLSVNDTSNDYISESKQI